MLNVASIIIKGFMGRQGSKWVLSAAALAGLGGPSIAQAHHDERPRVDVQIAIGEPRREECVDREVKVWVPAVYRTVCDKQWVEPVYQDRCDRVWVEPVYETRCNRVWVPEVVDVRNVRVYDSSCHRWTIIQQRVVVRPGHYDSCDTRVCVTEGHFQEVHTRVQVTEGHFETADRQVLVADGHWDVHVEHVRVEHARSPLSVILPIPLPPFPR